MSFSNKIVLDNTISNKIKENHYYKNKINILYKELYLPWDISNMIVIDHIIPIPLNKITKFLKYSFKIRKNFFYLKKCIRSHTQPIDSLENLWQWIDDISNYCTCPFCNSDQNYVNGLILNRESCYTKKTIYKLLSNYFECVPLYRRGSYEKYYSYIFRKLKGNRKHARSNILKISKLCANIGIILSH
jgi:hypothetical protein